MQLTISGINWAAVAVSVIVGQAISTVWFTVLFGEPWAKEYGVSTRQQHTKEIAGYTYGVQALCTIVLVLSLAVLQRSLAVASVAEAARLGLLVALGFCVATGVPGQAFLKRWRVAALAFGCQVVMIVAVSIVLGRWR